jgi:hypothetical protein
VLHLVERTHDFIGQFASLGQARKKMDSLLVKAAMSAA